MALVKAGSEFLVNTYTSGIQASPQIATLSGGGFVITWESNNQVSSASGHDIYAQRYAADGSKAGSEFLVNTYTSNEQASSAITALSDGGFIITWTSFNQTSSTSSNDIYAQRYAADGSKAGSEFLVNTYTADAQQYSVITALSDGGFIITWQSVSQVSSTSDFDIYAQRYAADGSKVGNEFLVNTYTADGQQRPVITALSDGGFVITWMSYNQVSSASSYDIYAQRYAADGSKVGNEFLVNTYTADAQLYSVITALSDGGFVITWMSYNQVNSTYSYDIYAQRYAADGSKVGNEFLVNTYTTGEQQRPVITALSDGGFVITWQSNNQVSGSSKYDIYAQRYTVDGSKVGNEFLINTYTADEQQRPAITALSNGGIVITWYSNNQVSSSSSYDIYAQRFVPDEVPVLSVSRAAFTFTKKGAAVTIDSGLTLTNSATLSTATVSFSTGFVANEDELLFNAQTGITGSYNAATGVLSLTGTASLANYQTALRSITYRNTNTQNPNMQTRTVNMVVYNGYFDSNTANWGLRIFTGNEVFVKSGNEFLVNTYTSENQQFTAITALKDGGFIVTWQSYGQAGGVSVGDIYAQRYAADGSKAGNEFLVNTYTANDQLYPATTALNDGGFIIAWQSYDQAYAGSLYDVFAQRYAADGSKVGSDFRVNTQAYENQQFVAITALKDGGFIITWQSYAQVSGSSVGDIFAQRYAADGSAVGSEFLVSTYTANDQLYPATAALSDGGFVITWQSYGQASGGSNYDIYAQRYAADGSKVGNEFLVNSYTIDTQEFPAITALKDGGFIITWQSNNQMSGYDIYAQRYAADNSRVGIECLVNTYTTDHQVSTAITALSDGGFVITWQSNNQVSGSFNNDIYAQRYTVDGSKVGSEFLVNTYTSDEQQRPAITALSNGGMVISWHSLNQVSGSSSYDIYAQRFALVETPILSVSRAAFGFTQKGAPVTIDSGLTLTNSATLSMATISFSSGFVANEDELLFNAQAGITGSYNAATGVLSLTGTASLANYQTALRSITYRNKNIQNPNMQARAVSMVVNNGYFDSNTTNWGLSILLGNAALVKAGSEFLVNTYTSDAQQRSAMTALSDGGFVITWLSNNQVSAGIDIYAQRYAADGSKVGNEFLVNTYTSDVQQDSAIIALSNGGFVISWESLNQVSSTSSYDIYAQRYAADGSKVGSEFLVNTFTSDTQMNSVITALSDGGFVIAWQSLNQVNSTSSYDIHAQRYAANGSKVGSVFLVNTYTSDSQQGPAITALSDGGFIITWESNRQGSGSSPFDICAQRYAADGNKVGNEFLVNTYTNNSQEYPAITVLSDGGFVITWQSLNQVSGSSSFDIYAQRYASDSSKVGNEFLVNTYTADSQQRAVVTALSDGGFVITWQNNNQASGSLNNDIYAQRYTVDGSKVGSEFLVNTYISDEQQRPAITALSNGGMVISWHSLNQVSGSSSYDIYAQRFALVETPVLSVSRASFNFTQKGTPVTIDSGLKLTNSVTLSSATVSFSSGFVASEDELLFTAQAGITGSYNAATGVLSLTGTASLVNYQTALRSITYRNKNTQNPTMQARTVNMVVNNGFTNSNSGSWGLSILPASLLPVVATSSGSINFTENGSAIIIDAGLNVSNVDNADLTSAYVTVMLETGYIVKEDLLTFIDQRGITGSYHAGVGLLLLRGLASVADYQAALRSVTYRNLSQNPNTRARTISFVVSNVRVSSEAAMRTLKVIAVNNAPVVVTSTGSVNLAKDTHSVIIDNAITVSDVDSVFLASATVSISGGFLASEDSLSFTTQPGITGSYDESTGILSLTGTARIVDYQMALRSVTYANLAQNPNTQARTISFVVNDAQLSSTPATRTLTVLALNNAPVVATSMDSVSFTEGASPAIIDNAITLSDSDNTDLHGATVSISDGFIASEDRLAFTNLAGITGNYDEATGILNLTGTAPLADYQTALRSVTYANLSPDPITQARTISFVVNDAETSSTPATRRLIVVAVNNAPIVVTSSGNVSFISKGSATVIDTDLIVSDADSARLKSATVSITSGFVPSEDELAVATHADISSNYDAATGVLTLTGTAFISDYQIALRSVTYRNRNAIDPDLQPRVIDFVVSDGGLSSSPASRRVNVIAFNEPPVVINPLPEQRVRVGKPFNFTLAADSFFDAEAEALSLSAQQADGQALPAWVSFDAKTQRFNGTALTAGVANFTVTAQDPQGASAQMPVNLAITPQPTSGLSREAKIGIGIGVGVGAAAGLGLVGLAAGALGFGLFAHWRRKPLTVVVPKADDTKDIELGEVKAERGTDIHIQL
ncbi:MAG: secreted protein of unknown function [Gammaproteobacteria bacterium]|nr:secreted protein of unknown function [Gammaproteobacteria bacterium]